MTSQAAARVGLEQEMTAIVAIDPAMLGTMPFTTSRLEARIECVEARIGGVAADIQAEDRADHELFTREILRLTTEQSCIAGIVEGARDP